MAERITCPECHGARVLTVPGKKGLKVTCGRCKGTGQVTK